MKQDKNSSSSAQSSKTTVEKTKPKNDDDVVFITILRGDRNWINTTKGKLTREQRLHQIFENYRKAGMDAQYSINSSEEI